MWGSEVAASRDDVDQHGSHFRLLVLVKLAREPPPRPLDPGLEGEVPVEHPWPGEGSLEHLGGRDQLSRRCRLPWHVSWRFACHMWRLAFLGEQPSFAPAEMRENLVDIGHIDSAVGTAPLRAVAEFLEVRTGNLSASPHLVVEVVPCQSVSPFMTERFECSVEIKTA